MPSIINFMLDFLCGLLYKRDMEDHTMTDTNTEATIADAREIEQRASNIIGRFFSACGGRHHYGHTCDYCLANDVLRAARALLARMEG